MLSRLKCGFLPALLLCSDGAYAAPPSFDNWTVVEPTAPIATVLETGCGIVQQQVGAAPTDCNQGVPADAGGFSQVPVIEDPGSAAASTCSTITFVNATGTVTNTIGEAVDSISPRAYIPNGPDGTVSVIDTQTYQTVATLPVGLFPYGVAIDPRGLRAYVSNRGSDSVSVIDADTLGVTDTIQTSTTPAGLAMDRQGGRLLIALESANAVSVVGADALTESRRIALNNPPHDIALSPAAPIAYVLSRSAAVISVIDLDTLREIGVIPLAVDNHTQPTAMIVSPDGARIYTVLMTPDQTSSVLTVIDAATQQVSYVATFARPIIDVTQSADGSSVYLVPYAADGCTDIQEIATASYALVKTYAAAGGLVRASYDQQGFHVISRDSDAFRTYRITAEGTSSSLAAETGDQPMALGDFIGPVRAPVAMPDAVLIDFGAVALNGSAVRTLTVTNTGNLPLKIYQTSIEGPMVGCASGQCGFRADGSEFSVPEDDCAGNTLAVDASCTIAVQFAPVAGVLPGGTLRLHTNSGPLALGISLVGTLSSPASVATSSGGEAVVTSGVTADDDAEKGGGGALGPVELLFAALVCLGCALPGLRRQ